MTQQLSEFSQFNQLPPPLRTDFSSLINPAYQNEILDYGWQIDDTAAQTKLSLELQLDLEALLNEDEDIPFTLCQQESALFGNEPRTPILQAKDRNNINLLFPDNDFEITWDDSEFWENSPQISLQPDFDIDIDLSEI